jgi:hypothetical protein
MNASTSTRPLRFPIRLGPKSRPLLLLFGVRQGNAWVDLTPTELVANFGFYHLRVALTNIASWRIEGPWLWITAIGVRRGVRAGDMTFGGNHKGGVRIDFKAPERRNILSIPRLYVTVADLVGLGAALAAAGIPGEDARPRSVNELADA